ncbi:hypothetical protein [Cohnella silvisoli]
MRETADVGDIVRVQKHVPSLLPGVMKRESRKLVEAVVLERVKISSTYQYRIRLLEDNSVQTGNGHMIKLIVRKGGDGNSQTPLSSSYTANHYSAAARS